MDRFEFQRQQARFPCLNAGCFDDPARLGLLGATNLDISPINNLTGKRHVVPNFMEGDIRNPPERLKGAFASVVLGDILEHMTDENIGKALEGAKSCLRPRGVLVITVPEDDRLKEDEWLAPGVNRCHINLIDAAKLRRLLKAAHLRAREWLEVNYGFVPRGFLVVAEVEQVVGFLEGEALGKRLEHLVEDRRQSEWHDLRLGVRRREKQARWRTRAAERGHPFVCRECGRSFPGTMKNAFRNHIRECRGGDDIEEDL